MYSEWRDESVVYRLIRPGVIPREVEGNMLKVEVSYRGLVVVGLAVLSLWALIHLWPIVLLVITAVIFMVALLPYVEWLCRHGFPRVGAVLLLLVALLAILIGLFALVTPAVVGEFRDLRQNLPQDARKVEEFAANLGFNTENWNLEQNARDIDWTSLISGRAAVDYGQKVVLGFVSAFTVIVLTAYLLVDTPRLSGFLYRFVPPGREPEVEHFLQALKRVVGGYVRGQIITSLVIGTFTLTVLLILRVPNAIAFAVLAGFSDIVPLVGPFIAVVPATLAGLQESPTTAVVVLVALLAYQQFEDRFLFPRIYSQTLNLPPMVVLLAVLVGGELLGVPGILLALPAAAAGRVFLDYYLDRRTSGVTTQGSSTTEILAPDTEATEA